jgi:hypothetical protein
LNTRCEDEMEQRQVSLGQAFLFAAIKAAAWAAPVVASSLLVIWLNKKLFDGGNDMTVVTRK